MDRRPKKMATGCKARVALIYSWSSRAGHNEACYLGGRLQLGGYSDVSIVAFSEKEVQGKGCQEEGFPPPIFNLAGGGVMVPSCHEYRYRGWEVFREERKMSLIFVLVEKLDGLQCGRRLNMVFNECHNDRNDVAVVNLQCGIRAFPGLGLTSQADILVLDGVIGISVARGEKGELYQTLGPSFGYIVIERLKRNEATRGEKFLNLIESSEIPLLFRRRLLPYVYGGISYDLYQGLAALTIMDMKNFATNYCSRRAWRILLIECSQILSRAARMIALLQLPPPIFNLAAAIIGLDPPSYLFLSLHGNAEATKQRTIASINDIVTLATRHGYSPKGLGALRQALMDSNRLTPAELLSLVLTTSGEEELVQVVQDDGKKKSRTTKVQNYKSMSSRITSAAAVCIIATAFAMMSARRVESWGAFPILLVVVFIAIAHFTKGSTGY